MGKAEQLIVIIWDGEISKWLITVCQQQVSR